MKKLVFSFLFLILACSLCVFGACNAPVTNETAGGKDVYPEIDTVSIVGAENIYITKNVTEITSYIDKVYALSNGNVDSVSVDSTNVKFGEKGEYDLIYSYKDLTEKVKVTVYDLPSIENTKQGVIEIEYNSLNTELLDGISAKDCFDNVLDLQILSDSGLYSNNVFANVGEFVLDIIAIDKAGQVVRTERTVNVVNSVSPVVEDLYSYNTIDDSLVIELSNADYPYFNAIEIDGKIIPNSVFNKKANQIIIDGNYLCDTFGVDKELDMRIGTANGVSNCKLALKDEGAVAYSVANVEEFLLNRFECFENYNVPKIILTNPRQNVTPVYTLYKNGVLVGELGNKVKFELDGSYNLVITFRNELLSYNFDVIYNLGYEDGFAVNPSEGLTAELRKGYTLKSMLVRDSSLNLMFAYISDSANFSDFEAFNGKVKQLNTKYKYFLDIKASTEDNKLVNQRIQFTVLPEGTVSFLSTYLDRVNNNVLPKESATTSLTYVNKFSGMNSVFKWSAKNSTNVHSRMLNVNAALSGNIKESKIISFDYYSTGANLLAFLHNEPGTKTDIYGYLWDINSTAKLEYKVYDLSGNDITSTLNSAGAFVNRWVTIELVVKGEFNNGIWNGLSVWANTLDSLDVYITNFTCGVVSRFADTRDNSVLIQTLNGDIDNKQNDIYN